MQPSYLEYAAGLFCYPGLTVQLPFIPVTHDPQTLVAHPKTMTSRSLTVPGLNQILRVWLETKHPFSAHICIFQGTLLAPSTHLITQ